MEVEMGVVNKEELGCVWGAVGGERGWVLP